MEALKKLEDSLEQFKKEAKAIESNYAGKQGHAKALESRIDDLKKELVSIEERKSQLESEIKLEKAVKIAELEFNLKTSKEARTKAEDELARARNEIERVKSRDLQLSELLAHAESEKKSAEEKNKILSDKLRKLNEIAA